MKKQLLVLLAFLLLVTSACTTPDETARQEFIPESVPPGNESSYQLSVTMDESGRFEAKAAIDITNVSEDSWENLVFYFMPNVFTAENDSSLENPAKVKMNAITLNGTTANYSLEKDTLTIPLEQSIAPGGAAEVSFDYTFTLPEKGVRFTKSEDGFYLAHWYPMVPTYRNGWNKKEYNPEGESYHTAYSDFKLTVTVPELYTAVTSGKDARAAADSEQMTIEQVKEVFIAILKEPSTVQGDVGGTELNIYGVDGDTAFHEEVFDYASDAFAYFESTFGPYPLGQLDVVLDEIGMEYPGVVTAGYVPGAPSAEETIIETVVHEIAHQWFYGLISNDPTDDPWLDEGLATMAEFLYFSYLTGEEPNFDELARWYEKDYPLAVNRPVDGYGEEEWAYYVYGKPGAELGALLQDRGGTERVESFLNRYTELYRFKEVSTEEFIRFLEYELDLEGNEAYSDWLEPEEVLE